jgi:hypothetical protein
MLTLLLFPALYLKMTMLQNRLVGQLFDVSLFLIATCSASTFYVASQREIFRTWADSIKYLPFLMSLGVGVSLNNARAALEGLLGHESEFVRTPKFGVTANGVASTRRVSDRRRRSRIFQGCLELVFGVYLLGCVLLTTFNLRATWGLPFLVLFMGRSESPRICLTVPMASDSLPLARTHSHCSNVRGVAAASWKECTSWRLHGPSRGTGVFT